MTQPIARLLPLKTPAAARALGVTYHILRGLIRFYKLDPLPQRDSTGDFVWFPEDMERARVLLASHRRPAPQTSNNER
jgi:hypothetical protein